MSRIHKIIQTGCSKLEHSFKRTTIPSKIQEVLGFTEHGPAFNLVLSSPLNLSCLWQSPLWWQEDQNARKREPGGEREN